MKPKLLTFFRGLQLLTLLLHIFVFAVLPFFYEQKLKTGIFHVDLYLFVLAGSMAWICLTFQPGEILQKKPLWMLLLFFTYAIGLVCWKAWPDSNSFGVLLFMISSLGVLFFWIRIQTSGYRVLLFIVVIASFLFQVTTGYMDLVQKGSEPLNIRGQFHNSGFFANFLAGGLPLILAAALNTSFHQLTRILFWGILILSSVLLVITEARSAIIGSAIGLISVIYFMKFSIAKKRIPLKTILILLFIITITFVFTLSFSIKRSSAIGRLTVYNNCLRIIKEHPLIGVAPGQFVVHYNNYQSAYFQNKVVPVNIQILADDNFEAFNSVLQILVEYGIIGLILIAWLSYTIKKNTSARSANVKELWLYNASRACLVAIFVSSLFSNPFHCSPIFLVSLYHLSVILASSSGISVKESQLNSNKRFFLPIVLVGVIIINYYCIRQYRGEKIWYKAAETAKYEGYESAKKLYEKASYLLGANGYFLFNYGAEAFLGGDHQKAMIIFEQCTRYYSASSLYLLLADNYASMNRFELAEQNYLHSIFMVPSRIVPRYQLIQLYVRWGRLDEAKAWLDATLNWPIKVPTVYTASLIAKLRVLEKELK